MLVLGLNFGHDASASVVRDGEVLSVILRERVSRLKRAAGLDRETVELALSQAGIDLAEVDYVALSTAQRRPFIAINCGFSVTVGATEAHPSPGRMLHASRKRGSVILANVRDNPRNYIDGAPSDAELELFPPLDQFHYSEAWLDEGGLADIAAKDHGRCLEESHVDYLHCPVTVALLGKVKPGYIVHHHLCHAAGAFYTSPFEESFILTMDGAGTTPYGYYAGMIYQGRGDDLFPLTPHHLFTSCLYDRTAIWLGLGDHSAPGKLMGLAPYGEPLFFDPRYVGNWHDVSRALDLHIPHLLAHPIIIWQHVWRSHIAALAGRLGLDMTHVGDKQRVTERLGASIARSIQLIFEETILAAVRAIEKIGDDNSYPTKRLIFSGGSALNVVANNRILTDTAVEDLFVNPGCDDMGLSVGAALAVTHPILGCPRHAGTRNDSAYFGRRFTAGQVKDALNAEPKVSFEKLDDWSDRAAREIRDGGIGGWFEGRSEIGPRALGHRSLVADPTRADSWERVNLVKGRELWRPLAPSCLEDATTGYFHEMPKCSPYMNINARVADRRLPAITHVDGTSRVQTVDPSCGAYHDMISAFGRLSGHPVVLNTSLNGPDEPIVDTPQDALRFLLDRPIDALYIEGYRVARR